VIHTPKSLANDASWRNKLNEVCQKYGIFADEVYDIIKGETWPKWNFASYNKSTKAAGAFQFIPSTLDFINKKYGSNYTTEGVLKLRPVDQLHLYDLYLRAWGYDGSVALGFMQAAPGMFSKLKRNNDRITDDLLVYDKNTRAWRVNPAWREPNDGPITVGSINRYYNHAS